MGEACVTIGAYPRDDVSCVKDDKVREGRATILVRQTDGTLRPVDEVTMNDLWVLHPDVKIGEEFYIDLHARFESRVYDRRVAFTATDNEHQVFVSAIGLGAQAEPKAGRFRRRRYSGFEFGMLVMGATTEQGSPVLVGGPLVEHGPGDGVGAAPSGYRN